MSREQAYRSAIVRVCLHYAALVAAPRRLQVTIWSYDAVGGPNDDAAVFARRNDVSSLDVVLNAKYRGFVSFPRSYFLKA